MANIMLNKACNLQCPYCFANEFVNNQESMKNHKNNISEDNFREAVEFIIKSGESFVGLIGGEPTIHPDFEKYVNILIEREEITGITIFSNGILLDKFFHLLDSPKVSVLINCNSPADIGEKNFNRLKSNVERMVSEFYARDQFTLGINMYKPDFEYEYILELLKKYKMPKVRTAIAVPNLDEKRNVNIIEYFTEMKPRIFEFFGELLKIGCMPTYDCNNMPVCITTQEEKDWLSEFWKLEPKAGTRCNITDNPVCSPVIDILPDLTVVRCFGMSELAKANLRDFHSTMEISGYFVQQIDSLGYLIPTAEECKDCPARKSHCCSGGCLAFKAKQIQYMREYIDRRYDMSSKF